MSKVNKTKKSIRPSPSVSATDYDIGTIKKGSDGNKWIILQTKSKINRWVKLTGRVRVFDTWDNGAYPFRVVISDKLIVVFKGDYNSTEKYYFCEKNVLTLNKFKRVFVGRNMPSQSYYKQPFTGNSILIEIKHLTYIYIGESIKQFRTPEPIIKYVSNMGNSSVPYPYALSDDFAYIMLDNVYMRRDFGNIDPYVVHYDHKKQYQDEKKYKMMGVKVIQKRSR
jgi:hypothetical protein